MSETRSIGGMMNREDHSFLERQLLRVEPRKKAGIRAEYKRHFLAGYDAEPVEHRKENAGRRRANSWLFQYTDPRGS